MWQILLTCHTVYCRASWNVCAFIYQMPHVTCHMSHVGHMWVTCGSQVGHMWVTCGQWVTCGSHVAHMSHVGHKWVTCHMWVTSGSHVAVPISHVVHLWHVTCVFFIRACTMFFCLFFQFFAFYILIEMELRIH